MKRTLEAVIFDMDGVIVDTFDLYYRANKFIANRLNVPFTYEDNDQFKGIRRLEIVKRLAQRSENSFNEAELIQLAEEKNHYYQKLLQEMNETSLLPGITTFIQSLKQNDIKIAIASSSTNGETVLKKVGLYHEMDCIIDPRTLKNGKPDPEIFLRAADCLHVAYRNCAAIEDGQAGMTAILATDMFSIGVGDSPGMDQSEWRVQRTSELTYEELIRRMEG